MSQVAMRGGPSTSTPNDASRTITIRDSRTLEEGESVAEEVGRLQLRATRPRDRPRVVWSDDVVDNEGMGKKSSKICCIYHRPKRFDESSSSDDSSDSDSDSSCDHTHPHSHGARRHRRHRPQPDSVNGPQNGDGTLSREGGESVVHGLESDSEDRNMYERVPRRNKGKGVARNEA